MTRAFILYSMLLIKPNEIPFAFDSIVEKRPKDAIHMFVFLAEMNAYIRMRSIELIGPLIKSQNEM